MTRPGPPDEPDRRDREGAVQRRDRGAIDGRRIAPPTSRRGSRRQGTSSSRSSRGTRARRASSSARRGDRRCRARRRARRRSAAPPRTCWQAQRGAHVTTVVDMSRMHVYQPGFLYLAMGQADGPWLTRDERTAAPVTSILPSSGRSETRTPARWSSSGAGASHGTPTCSRPERDSCRTRSPDSERAPSRLLPRGRRRPVRTSGGSGEAG